MVAHIEEIEEVEEIAIDAGSSSSGPTVPLIKPLNKPPQFSFTPPSPSRPPPPPPQPTPDPAPPAQPTPPADPADPAPPAPTAPAAPQTIESMANQLAGKAHIYVAVPCYNCQMRSEFATSLMQLQAICLRYGVQVSVQLMGNESLISRGRCILTGNFLASPANFLLFIDSDIAFNPATVFRLALHNKEICSAVYPKKSINWDLVRQKKMSGSEMREDIRSSGVDFNINIIGGKATIENGFVRVLDAATGFFMMRRDAVERLTKHYEEELSCVNDIPGSNEAVPKYVAIFDTMIDVESRRYLSEDYALCRRAQALDPPMEIWADVASPLTHIGSMALEGDITQRFEMRYVG